jgi:hypothetical protein
MYRFYFLAPLALLVACGQGNQGLTDDAEFGRIAGFVTDVDGTPLVNVAVEAQDQVVLTNADGSFILEAIEPGTGIVLEFTKDGYAKNYASAQILSWETANANAKMLSIDGTGQFIASEGGLIEVGEVSVNFQPNGILDSDGNPFSGTVNVAITHLDPYTNEIEGAPGDLTALGYEESGTSKSRTRAVQLLSYGMVDVTLTSNDGDELNLDEATPAQITMGIRNPDEEDDNLLLADGDQMETWSFDRTRGRWVEEGLGDVVERDGKLAFSFEATHFSWWNCDRGFVPSCATGRVLDFMGFPIRGAEVRCSGGRSNSTSYADSDGYYVCSVLVGDTVSFTGSTFVAHQNWTGSGGSYSLRGYGSSSADCQPIRDIVIDVCRVTGAINVENIKSVIDEGTQVDADNASAVFWEPLGEPSLCANPWDAVGMGQCYAYDKDDPSSFFPSSAVPGAPDDGRSVGTRVTIRAPGGDVRMNKTDIDGKPYYSSESLTSSNTGLDTTRPEFRGGDALGVETSGSTSDYMGPWSASRFAFVPGDIEWRNPDTYTFTGGGGLNLEYRGATGDSNGVLVFANSENGSQNLMCRFTDDGRITVPSSALSQLDAGYGGLGVYHMDDNYTVGPDGMPIRLQLFSGATTSIELDH